MFICIYYIYIISLHTPPWYVLFVNDQLYVRLSSGRVINIYDQFYGNKTIFKCLEVDVLVDLKKINSVWSPEKLNGVPLKIVKANPSWWRNLRLARSKVYMHLIAQVRMIWEWLCDNDHVHQYNHVSAPSASPAGSWSGSSRSCPPPAPAGILADLCETEEFGDVFHPMKTVIYL